MTADGDIRGEVVRLRRSSAFAPVPVGAALVPALALALIGRNEIGWLWGLLLALGIPLWIAVDRAGRRRDALVLAYDDETVRSYLRGRLAAQAALASRLWLLVVYGFGCVFFAAVYGEGSTPRHPAEPLLGLQLLLVGVTLLGSAVWRMVLAHLRKRRLAALGGPPSSAPPEPWLVETTHRVNDAEGAAYAALFWHEATGVAMKEAKRAVAALPPPQQPADGAGPPDEVVRATVRKLRRSVLAGQAAILAMLLALTATQQWARGWPAGPAASELTTSQKIYAAVAAFIVLVAMASWNMHTKALRGTPASLRAHCRRMLEMRLRRIAKWSPLAILLAVFALYLVGTAVLRIATDVLEERPIRGFPRLVESLIFVLWFIAIPLHARLRGLPKERRQFEELFGAGEPPPIPPVA